jgi:hypothetical protein
VGVALGLRVLVALGMPAAGLLWAAPGSGLAVALDRAGEDTAGIAVTTGEDRDAAVCR